MIPCNAEEVPYRIGGNEKIVTKDGSIISAEILEDAAAADGLGYIAHFANCPSYRKVKKHGK